jgi:hypothetical protein
VAAPHLHVVLPQGLRPGHPKEVVLDHIQVPPLVHTVGVDRAPVGVGSWSQSPTLQVVEEAGNPPVTYQRLRALVGRCWRRRIGAAPCRGNDTLAILSRSG